MRPIVCMITTYESPQTSKQHSVPRMPYPRKLKDSLESYPTNYGEEFQPFLQGQQPTCTICQDSMHIEAECQYHQRQQSQPDVDLESYKGSFRNCRLCNAAGHGAYDCNWHKYGSNLVLNRIKSLNGNPPPLPTEIYSIDNDIQDVIGNTLDNFWIAQDKTIVFKEATAMITLVDHDIALYGGCNVPLIKIIDTQKGDRVYTNQEWYHQHLLHGCWRLTCPYTANNYHPSKYEPLVHPDLNRCIGLLRGLA